MSTAIMTRPVEQGEWAIMREQASILVQTGFLPEAIRTPEQAVAIMLKGRELSIPAMYALSNIAVIKGKPVANAELMLALVYRDHGDNAIRFVESDEHRCTIEYRRRAWAKPERYSFTIQDAKTAQITGNQTWSKYPKAMLRARCISAVARMAFADSIGGLYTPEELGATVMVTDEGEVQTTVIDAAPEPGMFDEPPRQPKTNNVQASEASVRRGKIYRRLRVLLGEAKVLGVSTAEVDQAMMDDDLPNTQLEELGMVFAAAITAAREANAEPAAAVVEGELVGA